MRCHILLPWGKSTTCALSPSGRYPLLAHLIDTALVADAVWTTTMSEQVRHSVARYFGTPSADEAHALFVATAALHDIGKAEPLFQTQDGEPNCAPARSAIEEAGLSLDAPLERRWSAVGDDWRHLRHEEIANAVLAARSDLHPGVGLLVAGHHGRWAAEPNGLQRRPAGRHRRQVVDGPWGELELEIGAAALKAVGLESAADWSRPAAGTLGTTPVAAGWLSLADWIASDDDYVESSPINLITVPEDYATARRKGVTGQVRRTLGRPSTPRGTFEAVLGVDPETRPAQRWAAATAHGPGLEILTVEAGAGKTEAALWRHVAGNEDDGLLFALPTTAMCDEMFARVLKVYEGTDTFAELAHSRAILNDFYVSSDASPAGSGDVLEAGESDEDTTDGREPRPGDWFRGRQRRITAPLVVGTCDQALAAALNHRYATVRLAAIANKHLVLDEVHTYDPYQHRLLVRLLRWAGVNRQRVTLLSATLPTRRIGEYVGAYESGYVAAGELGEEACDLDDLPTPAPLTADEYSYPSVVVASDTHEVVPLEATRRHTIGLTTHPVEVPSRGGAAEYAEATAALVEQERERHPQARIGVVVNTVDRSIRVARALRATGAEVHLLHARMTPRQRSEKLDAIRGIVGKRATPRPAIIVATQIVEASLNLDFDILVTDLAPMTSLIQRLGRLWRFSVPTAAGWEHPEGVSRPTAQPEAHVIAPLLADGRLAGSHRWPYFLAELTKTYLAPACLDGGARRSLAIPEDVQASVDAADVGLGDLIGELAGAGDGYVSAVTAQVAAALNATRIADTAGIDPLELACESLRSDYRPQMLTDLTTGNLWSDAAVTRLRDQIDRAILVCDPTGEDRYAFAGTPADLLKKDLPLPVQREALSCVVTVSGALARALNKEFSPPPNWRRSAPPLLRDVLPVESEALSAVAFLDPEDGFVRSEETLPPES